MSEAIGASGETAGSASRNPQVMNPLWIISLFLGLSEVTVGIAAIQSSGWIQGLLALFATLFPIGVSIAFFRILWRRPYVLYAPGDFSEHTSVTSYVEAMTERYQPESAVEEVVKMAVESAIARIANDSSPQEKSSAVEFALGVAKEDLARRSITVNIGQMLGLPDDSTSAFTVPVDEMTTVNQLLGQIASRTGDLVRPHAYGTSWVVAADSQTYTDIGAGLSTAEQDERRLEEAGIPLGSTLSIRLTHGRQVRIIRQRPAAVHSFADLPKFDTPAELTSYLGANFTVMDLKAVGASLGLPMGGAHTKVHLIQRICEAAFSYKNADVFVRDRG